MRGVTLVFVLIFGMNAIRGDEILRGYMVAEDAFTCINTDAEVGIVSLDGSTLTPAGLKVAGCTLLSVKDGAANGQYIIEEQGDSTKQMTINVGDGTTFTETGTQLTFIAFGTTVALTGITSADVTPLTMPSGIFVARAIDDTDNTDCLKINGRYHKGSAIKACTDMLWYFVTAKCTACNCKACNPDPACCSECDDYETLATDQRSCVACYVDNCVTCDEPDVCVACSDGLFPVPNGTMCVACSSIFPDCETCVVRDGVTTCLDCESFNIPFWGDSECDISGAAYDGPSLLMEVIGLASLLLTIF